MPRAEQRPARCLASPGLRVPGSLSVFAFAVAWPADLAPLLSPVTLLHRCRVQLLTWKRPLHLLMWLLCCPSPSPVAGGQ